MLMLVPLTLVACWQYVRATPLIETNLPTSQPSEAVGTGIAR